MNDESGALLATECERESLGEQQHDAAAVQAMKTLRDGLPQWRLIVREAGGYR